MKSENLRCPECAAEITTGEGGYVQLKASLDTTGPVGVHKFLAVLKDDPVICPGCSVEMKVVRECEACKGKGNAITDELEDPSICRVCLGSREILEEQP